LLRSVVVRKATLSGGPLVGCPSAPLRVTQERAASGGGWVVGVVLRVASSPEPGSRKTGEVTIKDIATHLGLSHATVSRALNDHPFTSDRTKLKVHDAAAALGYIRNAGAGMMRGTRSKMVGFVAPDVQNDFYATVTKTLAESCTEAGMQLVLAVSEDDSELELRKVRALREARVAGIIITPTASPLRKTVELLKAIPTVQLVRSVAALGDVTVRIDDALGTFLSTNHLLELGHTRIGFIGGFGELSTGRDRLNGYQNSLAAMGIKVDEELIALGLPRSSFGFEATVRLLAVRKPPTALVLASSQLTLGALRAIQHLGLTVPSDLSLTGFGDPEWFALWGPGMTTVSLPTNEIAGTAAALLVRQARASGASDEPLSSRVTLAPRLIVRGSGGRING
jgi:DNA-binding LacI/PurR family transcriptional regulator